MTGGGVVSLGTGVGVGVGTGSGGAVATTMDTVEPSRLS